MKIMIFFVSYFNKSEILKNIRLFEDNLKNIDVEYAVINNCDEDVSIFDTLSKVTVITNKTRHPHPSFSHASGLLAAQMHSKSLHDFDVYILIDPDFFIVDYTILIKYLEFIVRNKIDLVNVDFGVYRFNKPRKNSVCPNFVMVSAKSDLFTAIDFSCDIDLSPSLLTKLIVWFCSRFVPWALIGTSKEPGYQGLVNSSLISVVKANVLDPLLLANRKKIWRMLDPLVPKDYQIFSRYKLSDQDNERLRRFDLPDIELVQLDGKLFAMHCRLMSLRSFNSDYSGISRYVGDVASILAESKEKN